MKLLTGIKWGANSRSLRNIYRALIRSKIDYGCEVYNSASHSVKKIVDRIQSQALRICTGASKNVATCSLQVEMGDPPYEERRKCLIAKSYLNIISHTDNHPTKQSLNRKATYLCHKKNIKENKNPYFKVATDMLINNEIDEINVYTFKQFPTPPWHLLKPTINCQLTNKISKKDNPYFIKSETDIMVDTQYNQYLKIYTDGSKDPQQKQSACAYSIPELKIKKGFKLPDHVSIFTSELMAIFLSLCWIEEFKPNRVVILVDSLSALKALKTNIFRVKNYILYDILFLYSKLTKLGTNILFEWVPSHVGIVGNESADKTAKQALNSSNVYCQIPVYKEDIKCLTKDILKKMWQYNWSTTTKGRTLHAVQSVVTYDISIPPMSRENERILFRVRSGHININKYLHMIGKCQSQMCDDCNVIDDLEHYLLNCRKYVSQRKILFETITSKGTINLSLKNLLSGYQQTFEPLLKYLLDTKVLIRK